MLPSELKLIDHKFLLETCELDTNSIHSYKQKNLITAVNPLKKFYSFLDLQNYLNKNPEILSMKDSGFAAYIGYEKQVEIVLYEEIKKIFVDEDTSTSEKQFIKEISNEIKNQENIFNKARFIKNVKTCQNYIREGDIYQANISEKVLISKQKLSQNQLLNIYHNLKTSNPSPYMSFFDFEHFSILSSSPESFMRFKLEDCDLYVESSPIKGTASLNEENILISSDKEKAEHLMIVDLIRNDIGKISKISSVKVKELMKKYRFKDLFHLISTIEGKIEEGHLIEIGEKILPDFDKIFSYCFPGGSITGAPKKRAMEIIKELESVPRALYTGSAGYYKFNEGGEFNILIRTLVYDKMTSELSLHSGAGITTDSDPEKEFKEIRLKAKNILNALKLDLEREKI